MRYRWLFSTMICLSFLAFTSTQPFQIYFAVLAALCAFESMKDF